MTQLILNNEIYLPKTSHDRYRCYRQPLTRTIEVISGEVTQQVRGSVQWVEYSYDYMGNELLRKVLNVLRYGNEFPATYLPDEGEEMQSGIFIVTSLTQPSFAFSRGNKPFWHKISFVLREAAPHD